MKKIIFSIFVPLSILGCSKASSQDGVVKGMVADSHGKPLKNVNVIIDHNIFFNSNISTKTDDNGMYSVKVPAGSWYAFAQHRITYNGKTYTLYLHPDNSSGFGGEGAVKNFIWMLEGVKSAPLTGTYGALITFDSYPGIYLDNENEIVFTFVPLGPLIDGSEGSVLTRTSSDGYQLPDMPIGKYKVSAMYRGHVLQLRKWNTEDVFVRELTIDIEPQISGQCDNCAKLEYRD